MKPLHNAILLHRNVGYYGVVEEMFLHIYRPITLGVWLEGWHDCGLLIGDVTLQAVVAIREEEQRETTS